jgi:hypothetical protein
MYMPEIVNGFFPFCRVVVADVPIGDFVGVETDDHL